MTLSPIGSRRTSRCVAIRSSARHHMLRLGLRARPSSREDPPLGGAVGIADVDLHQEAVELRLGQRIGAFLLQRILRRQHVEGLRQVVPLAGDRDMVLLHRLQQRRLRARAGPVDLVGHQQLREDRTLHETEAAPPSARFLQHLGAEDVGRHQIGRELHAPGVEAEHGAERLDELGLGEARHADKQAVAARQKRDQSLLDDLRPGRK